MGAYFKGSNPAVTIWVSDNYTRAAPGGTGEAKCGGNYAASLLAQAEASREGCDQWSSSTRSSGAGWKNSAA